MTLYVRIRDSGNRSKEVIAALRAKSKRRAMRHFAGKTVKHRVVKKDETSIEFVFDRRSRKPVNIRWRREVKPKVSPKVTRKKVRASSRKTKPR